MYPKSKQSVVSLKLRQKEQNTLSMFLRAKGFNLLSLGNLCWMMDFRGSLSLMNLMTKFQRWTYSLSFETRVYYFIRFSKVRDISKLRSTAKETPFESLKIKIWIIITKLINARKLKYLFSLEYEEKIMIFLTNFLSTR